MSYLLLNQQNIHFTLSNMKVPDAILLFQFSFYSYSMSKKKIITLFHFTISNLENSHVITTEYTLAKEGFIMTFMKIKILDITNIEESKHPNTLWRYFNKHMIKPKKLIVGLSKQCGEYTPFLYPFKETRSTSFNVGKFKYGRRKSWRQSRTSIQRDHKALRTPTINCENTHLSFLSQAHNWTLLLF